MNCAKCGTEIEIGFLCQKCADTAAQKVADGIKKAGSEKYLSAREAIIAMLDGATLVSPNGFSVRWKEDEGVFADTDENAPRDCFKGYRYQSSKPRNRPMDSWECLAWVNSPDSHGWLVSVKYITDEYWGDWDLPQRFRYDGRENYPEACSVSYRRARMLPDKSGIDESTIQGFLVEVV